MSHKIFTTETTKKNVNDTKAVNGENSTNSTAAARVTEREATATEKARALVNARRARALIWCDKRTLCEVINRWDVVSRRHFAKSAYLFARENKKAAELKIYGETFTFPVDRTADVNKLASYIVAIDAFFGGLDTAKDTQALRERKAAAKEADALKTIAAAQGIDVQTLLAALAAMKK